MANPVGKFSTKIFLISELKAIQENILAESHTKNFSTLTIEWFYRKIIKNFVIYDEVLWMEVVAIQ